MKRSEIQDAVGDLGWRYVLGTIRATVPVGSIGQAAEVAARCAAAGDARLQLQLTKDHVLLTLPAEAIESARRLTATVREEGLATGPGGTQLVELAIDALDIPAVKPFWRAIFAYEDEQGYPNAVVDPLGVGPAVWFQQMDAPRPQRNRIHFDISVPHDEAPARIEAALAAGGTLVSADRAPAFWVLADAEGNEACITTWQGRD
ncbi:VOC family protein [Dactylosporangium sp. NPDC005572]|uniref:VOC family protein n=1 Tax=Dactylosporangium sp. NPDC005572 TaxID=3156889 RepID=UPI0033AD0A58